MSEDKKHISKPAAGTEVDTFLRQVATTPALKPAGQRGRLVFALDATASREPSWERASHIQEQMFLETAALGGLAIQLCYYRGMAEFHASPWLVESTALLQTMREVHCLGGYTQIGKVLTHVIEETRRQKVSALVFVGDCVEEKVDHLCHQAGQLALLGVPAFMFHEGGDPLAENAFRQIARLTRGAYCRFDAGSAQQLRELLGAVAVYAAGGRRALEDYSRGAGALTRQLVHQLGKD